MSTKSIKFLLIITIISLTTCNNNNVARAQSSCTSALISMSSCLTYITGNSTTPPSSCCSALANVVQSQPQCLCSALSSGAASSLGVAINQTRALEMPASCNVQTPPVSKCSGGGGTTSTGAGAGAVGSPAESPNGVPETPSADFPSGSGFKAVPGNASDGSIIVKSSLRLVAFVVSCTSVIMATF